MLESLKEERSRHFQLALRIGIPIMVLVLVLAYAVFFRGNTAIALDTQSVVLMGGLIFVVVYFIYFALEQGQKESILDPITGVYKYDYFLRNIKKRHPKTLAAIKVENLGLINENYGTKRTDELLRDITEKLNRYLYIESSEYPLIGRKVGAEFLISMNQEATQVKELLEKFIKGHTEHNDIEVEYNYTLISFDNDNVEEAIEKLRDLLNTPHKSRLNENSDSIPNASMLSSEEQTIINSLKKENIELYFRPILNLKTNKIDIYEISVKLHSNNGNTLLPRHFLPVINRHNLGEQYDILIYSKVLSILPLIDDEISFSFNLSPFSLRKESFHKMMVSKLLESRVDAKRVIIELYEKKTHHRLENYLGVLSSLKRYGFRFCLDNFGSSNASMEYIKHFSFDIVQFDREYISDIDDKKHLSIFTSLVKMVKELDILTIAKWVDNQKTIDRLKEIDIDYIQGFSVGKVLREDELIAIHNPIKAKESDK